MTTITLTLSDADTATLNAGGNLVIALKGTKHVIVPPVIPPVVTPPAIASLVYANGVFYWPGDYNFGVTSDYRHAGEKPASLVIQNTLTHAWGGWLPCAPGWNFDLTPYTKLTLDLKPTVAGQKWNLYAMKVGDLAILGPNDSGSAVDLCRYGPPPIIGQWGTYVVPLANFMTDWSSGAPVVLKALYKFAVQDQTNLSSNVWFVDNVGFQH